MIHKKLLASPDKDSLFGVWGNACTGLGACSPLMSGPQEVTATFDFVKPAKVGTTLYDTLTAAYGDSAAGSILAGSTSSPAT